MSATITLPTELEEVLARKAAAEGVDIEKFAVDALRRIAEIQEDETISNGTSSTSRLHPNQRWLQAHRDKYRGQWVVLCQGNLIAHGEDGELVIQTARQQGIVEPFLAFISDEDLPFAGF